MFSEGLNENIYALTGFGICVSKVPDEDDS